MRKLLLSIMLLLVVPLLASCKVYYENRITVNADHSADVVLRLTVDKADLDVFERQSGGQVNLGQLKNRMTEIKSQFEQLGFQAQIIDAPGEYGLILSRHVADGRAFTAANAGVGQLGFFNQDAFHLNISDDAIRFAMKADLSPLRPVGDEVYDKASAVLSYTEFHKDSYARFVLELPYPVQRHNASFISPDARHLEWDLVPGQANELYAEAGQTATVPPAEPPTEVPGAEPPAAEEPAQEAPAGEAPSGEEPAREEPAGDSSPQPTAIVSTVVEQWNELITERNDEGRLVAFDRAEKNAFNFIGISDWRFSRYDRPVDRLKKVGYVVFVKWRFMVAEGFAELGSFLGE